MNKIIYPIQLILCLLLVATTLSATPEAEYRKLSKTWTVNADGSQEYHHSMELTLFTHTAMNNTYGESFIVYNPDYQTVVIHSAYTTQKDGSVVKTPDNAFVEVLPRFAADAPAYNGLKELVVVHTGLELGATIHLDYSILTKPGYYPALDINETLQETSPVKEYQIAIYAPADKPLTWQLYGSQAKATESQEADQRVIRWTLRDVPASSREAFLPQNHDGVPRLVASGYASQREALSTLAKRFQASVSYESETFGPYLVESLNDADAKVRTLQTHVVENMGYTAIPLSYTGYNIRDVDLALRSAYGTLAEKTRLLNVLLNAAGIPAEVVVVYPGNLHTDACGQSAIKDLAVKATVNGQERFLSAVSLTPSPITRRGDLDKVFTLDGTQVAVNAEPTVVREEIAISQIDTFGICTLPNASKGIDTWGMATLNSERQNRFELPALLKEEIVYTVTPGKGMRLETSTQERRIEKTFGKVVRTIVPKGDAIEVIRSIELNQPQYTPEEYDDLRALINEWTDPNNRVLLFSTDR